MAGLKSDLPEQALFPPCLAGASLASPSPEKYVWDTHTDLYIKIVLGIFHCAFHYQGLLLDQLPLKLPDILKGKTVAGKRNVG